MIELPDHIVPNGAAPLLVDFGHSQESASGTMIRIERPGNRFQVELSFPPMVADDGRQLAVRLTRAKNEGLRVDYPLQGVSQGAPGAPVVNGTDSGGRVLKLRGLTVGHVVKEGYWLNLIGSDGVRYLHMVAGTVAVGSDGLATLAVEPPLRIFPADGDAVELARPVIEGQIVSDIGWALSPGELAGGFSLTLREAV